jgi:hypothetical protein
MPPHQTADGPQPSNTAGSWGEVEGDVNEACPPAAFSLSVSSAPVYSSPRTNSNNSTSISDARSMKSPAKFS